MTIVTKDGIIYKEMRDAKYVVALYLFCFRGGIPVYTQTITDTLERTPIIAATDSDGWQKAVASDAEVLFHLNANIMTIASDIKKAKANHKYVFVHIDLAEGIGKDRTGIRWLSELGIDGIISTRAQLIRTAKECGLTAIQRFFVLDSKGMNSIGDMIDVSRPDLIEIMPGVIPKALRLFSEKGIPVIAGGLIETKSEITAALSAGAVAISTGKSGLWSIL